jgi:formylglycine-generating enzyme required for sulfatase activity
MINCIGHKLCQIINEYGHDICESPGRFKELLGDTPEQPVRAWNVLLIALEQGIPQALLRAPEVPYQLSLHRAIKRLYDDVGIAEEFARWAVDMWACVLGIIPIAPESPESGLMQIAPSNSPTYPLIFVPLCKASRVPYSENRVQLAEIEENFLGGILLEMIYIPGGTMLMGAPAGQGNDSEEPQHFVTIKPFYLGKYPITQAQYQAVMNCNPSHFTHDHHPVETVGWNDAIEFCEKLSQRSGKSYRLPSESEWEYACRAGTVTPFFCGEKLTTAFANYDSSYDDGHQKSNTPTLESTTPVGTYPINSFGLYDMHGNVWEWCLDVWHVNYIGAPITETAWLSGGKQQYRVLRGGSWGSTPNRVRSSSRIGANPDEHYNAWGFRVALSF